MCDNRKITRPVSTCVHQCHFGEDIAEIGLATISRAEPIKKTLLFAP
jgi:hypothetical protein